MKLNSVSILNGVNKYYATILTCCEICFFNIQIIFYSFFGFVTAVAFIGRVKREVKQNNVPNFYILHVEKILSSSSSDLSGFPSPASESTLLTHVPNAGFFPMKYSLRDLYIFVVRTDSNGKWVISDSYPYSKNLETVLENVCS